MTTSKWTLALNRCQEHRCQVHLTSALYTLSTCPRGPNLVHITPRRVVFEKQSCWKSESTERPSTWNWILNCQLVCTLSTYPRGPKFDRFHSTSSHFRGTRLSKIGRNIGNAQHISLTSNWLWTLCCPQSTLYTKYLHHRPTFWSVLLYDQPFWRYRTFNNSHWLTC